MQGGRLAFSVRGRRQLFSTKTGAAVNPETYECTANQSKSAARTNLGYPIICNICDLLLTGFEELLLFLLGKAFVAGVGDFIEDEVDFVFAGQGGAGFTAGGGR